MNSEKWKMESKTTEGSPLRNKSYMFAIRVVKLSQYLQDKKREFVLSKQVLRSGTAIGECIKIC